MEYLKEQRYRKIWDNDHMSMFELRMGDGISYPKKGDKCVINYKTILEDGTTHEEKNTMITLG